MQVNIMYVLFGSFPYFTLTAQCYTVKVKAALLKNLISIGNI